MRVDLIGQPAQTWERVSQNFLPNVITGYNLGTAIYDQVQQRRTQQALSQAYDPQTGQFDWGRAIAAVAPINPEAAIKMQQQKRLADQEQMGMEYLRTALGGAGTPATGVQNGVVGIDPVSGRMVLAGGLLKGDIGGAMMKVGELGQNAYQQSVARGQELVEVWDPAQQRYFKVPRASLSGQPAPAGQPAIPAGQLAIPAGQLATPTAQPIPPGQPAPTGQPAPKGTVKNLVDQYQEQPWFSDALSYARLYNIKPEVAIALIHQESGGNPKAIGTSGEIGLMQLMPGTAQRFGVTDPYNPTQNIKAGLQYFRTLLDRYHNDYNLALSAYNQGEGNLDRRGVVNQGYVNSVTGTANRIALPGGAPTGAPTGAPMGAPAPVVAPPGGFPTGPSEPEKQARDIETARQKSIIELQRQQQLALEEAQRQQLAAQQAIPNKLQIETGAAFINGPYKDMLGEIKQHQAMQQTLDTMERLNKAGITGPGQNFWTSVKDFLMAAGVPQSLVDITPEQQLVAKSNELIWTTLAQQKGPQTDNDFLRMQAVWPNLANTPEANQFLIDSARAVTTRRQAQINFYIKNIGKYNQAGNPAGVEDAWNNSPQGKASIWDEPGMKKWAAKFGNAGSAAGGGQPQAPAGTSGQPGAPSAKNYYLLLPDGKKITRDQLAAMPKAAQQGLLDRLNAGQIRKEEGD